MFFIEPNDAKWTCHFSGFPIRYDRYNPFSIFIVLSLQLWAESWGI